MYERNAGGTNAWGEVAKLTASDQAVFDSFGVSVSVDGDVALVGAYRADPDGMSSAGAAYVYERNAGGTNAWGEVTKLTASDKAADNYFGVSVSVAGDLALIGAPWAVPDGLNSTGAAYIYERNAGGTNAWGEVAKLTASDKAAADVFGGSVSVDGDIALVGAFLASPGGVYRAGAAYVYERNAGGTNTWGEVAKLTASDKWADDEFGCSVSVNGDVVLVGAFEEDPSYLYNAGAAYVYERNAGGTNAWGEVAKLSASDKALSAGFGLSVSVAGGVMLVGAPGAEPAGAAYIFEGLIGIPLAVVLGTNSAAIASAEAASAAKGTDFGSIPWGQSQTNTFAITNAGSAALLISGVTTNGTGAASFTVLGMPATVAAGTASNVSVVFSPGAVQTFTCVVAIANNSSTTPYLLNVTGMATKADQAMDNFLPANGSDFATAHAVGLSAAASSGLAVTFSVFSGPGQLDGTGTNLTFTGTGLVSVVASQAGDDNWNPAPGLTNMFQILDFTLTIQSTYGIPEPASGIYALAADAIWTNGVTEPAPVDGTRWVCIGWAMTGHSPESGSETQMVMTVTNDAVLTWLWNTNYWLAAAAGEHGLIDAGDGWQPAGTATQITATAEAYYRFASWSGDAAGSDNPLDLLMDSPKSVQAEFAAILAAHDTPEWWLAQHGWTSDFDAAATNDAEPDGYPTWQEFVADTDPGNSSSYPRVASVLASGAVSVITWPASTGRIYQIHRCGDLGTGEWVTQQLFLGTGEWTDTNLPPAAKRYYRIAPMLP